MKTNKLAVFLLPLLPFASLSAQDTPAEFSMEDVVIVEGSAPSASPSQAPAQPAPPAADQPVAVIEIPEAEIEGASIDVDVPDIPVATQSLPDETEVVLELPGAEAQSPGEATMASEETISVDFPDEDVRTILRNVADLFELNLVIPDTLQGRTSLKLRNITWRQVFEVVLDPLGYTYLEDRNIIRIKSIDEISTEPVDTRVFIVNYAQASEIQGSVQALVDAAAGGQIRIDNRSNALVITERPSRMNRIQEIIESLDRPNHQVMIESKFVEVTNSDVRNLGVNWASLSGYGLSAGPFNRQWERRRSSSDSSSTDDSRTSSSSTDTTSGSVDGFPDPEVISTDESVSTAFDALSQMTSTASTSRVDTAVFSADAFNVVLSALEQLRDVELISNPTVVVLNNENAFFQVGQDYPIREFEYNPETGSIEPGDLSKVELGITLAVTPSANAAGMINLDIEPRVTTLAGTVETIPGLEDPLIEVKTTRTKVTIKDGFTLALGGLTEQTTVSSSNEVPVLGKLPGVGRLFRSNSDNVEQRNLIIFITAKTLNPDGSTYREVIDPRVIDRMGITPADVPGYQLPADQRSALEELEALRIRAKDAEFLGEMEARLRAIEEKQREKEAKEAEADAE